MALGIRPTHLDSHMGSLFTTPALLYDGWGSAWPQRDYDVVNPEFKKELADNKVILIKWRDLQKLVQQ